MDTCKSPWAFTRDEADKKNTTFVVSCMEIQLKKMFPLVDDERITEVAVIAEKAMTKFEDILESDELARKLGEIAEDIDHSEAAHQVLSRFAPNIMGALVHKGPEILDGTFTAQAFFDMFGK